MCQPSDQNDFIGSGCPSHMLLGILTGEQNEGHCGNIAARAHVQLMDRRIHSRLSGMHFKNLTVIRSSAVALTEAPQGSFQQMWVSRAEYTEQGASVIDKKCP